MARSLTEAFKTPPLESYEAYRAAQKVARLTTVISVVLGIICLSLIGLVIAIFPLKEVQPMLITVKEKGEQIVRIEPIEKNVQAIEQLKETLARQYVMLRETFDLQSEKERWKQLTLMSSDKLAAEFQSQMSPNTADSPFKKRMQEGTTRSVRVLSSASLAPSASNIFQVEWVSEDRHQGQVVGTAHWLSTLTVSLEERSFDYEDQYINPIGFTVSHYTVARKRDVREEEVKNEVKEQIIENELLK
jgi:type IV secretion system protein VirB8